MTTIAGDASQTNVAGLPAGGHADGVGSAASFLNPFGLAMDSAGNLYVADESNCTIRKVTPAGPGWVVTTLAGLWGVSGSTDGTNSGARFTFPDGLVVDNTGSVLVADTANNMIRKMTPAGTNWVVTTVAGTNRPTGIADGLGSAARFYNPSGVAMDSAGNLYVADTQNHRITKGVPKFAPAMATPGVLSPGLAGAASRQTLAATGGQAPYTWSVVSNSLPSVFSLDSASGAITGQVLDPCVVNFRVRVTGADALFSEQDFSLTVEPSPGPVIRTSTVLSPGVAGSTYVLTLVASGGTPPYTWSVGSNSLPSGLSLSPDGVISGTPGAATSINFTVVVTGSDGLFTTTTFTLAIDPALPVTGVYAWTNFVGQPGTAGTNDGNGSAARFNGPMGIVVDDAGNVLVADYRNCTIRRVTPAGEVTALAGSAGKPGSADGSGSGAQFSGPAAAAVDRVGNLFVADQMNDIVRRVTAAGSVTTPAGTAGKMGGTDGTNGAARFATLGGVAVDGVGNVFVADGGNKTIRKVTPVGTNWLVTTIGGTAGVAGSADGIGSSASFGQPAGIAVDRAGNLYVADFSTHRLAKGTPSMLRPTITVGFDQAQLSLSWPPEYLGWSLQAQTNTPGAGLGTNWFVVPGSATTNQWTIPFDLASPGVFFQLRQGP